MYGQTLIIVCSINASARDMGITTVLNRSLVTFAFGHERAVVGALLLCGLMNAWGVVFQVEGSERAMRIDHDGHLALWGCNGAAESEAVRLTKLMLP